MADDEVLDFQDIDIPCDSLVAIRYLRSQFPSTSGSVASFKGLCPFALHSQIYASVPDRTAVDRELQALCSSGDIRILRLPTAKGDKAAVLDTDYRAQINAAVESVTEFLARSSADHENSNVPAPAQGPSKWMQDFKRRRLGDSTQSAHAQEAATLPGELHSPSIEAIADGKAADDAQADSLRRQGATQPRRKQAVSLHRESSTTGHKGTLGRAAGLASLKSKGIVKGRRGGALDGFLTKQEKEVIAAAAAATGGGSSRKENVAGSRKAGVGVVGVQGRLARGMEESQFRSGPEKLRPQFASSVPGAFTPRTTQEVSTTRATGREDTLVTTAGGSGCTREAERRLLGLQRFRDVVLKEARDAFILRSELIQHLSTSGHSANDSDISWLMEAGFLTRRDSEGTESFWFSIPNLGPVLKQLNQGRRELLRFFKHTRYKEISEVALNSRRLTTSLFSIAFHIRDFLGLGWLEKVDVPSGTILRLALVGRDT